MAFLRSDSTAVDVSASAPQATNYIDMLKKLVAFASNSSATTVAVNTAGASYVVGDIVELDGGSHPSDLSGATATFEVTSVDGGGGVTGIRLRNAGSYSTTPGTTNISTTALGTVNGDDNLTVDVTYANNGWTVTRRTQEIDTAVIGADTGSGYATGDDLDIVGGDTRVGLDSPRTASPGQVEVPGTISTGQSFTILDRGVYHRTPGLDEIATNVVTGSGDNAMTADLTYRDISDTTTDIEVILSGANGAIVGIRTFSDDSTYFNWEIAGLPAYTAGNDWEAQPNISPGRYEDADTGQYIVLRDIAFNYTLNITDRRIVATFNIDNGVYIPLYLGLTNAFATATEFALPLMVNGCSSRRNFGHTIDGARFVGMNGCIAESNSDPNGPCAVYSPGGVWYKVRNGTRSGSDILGDEDQIHIIPGGWFNSDDSDLPTADQIVQAEGAGLKQDWESFASAATATGASGADAPTDTLLPTRGTGDDEIPLVEFICVGIEPIAQNFGELDGVKWVERTLHVGTLNAEELIESGGDLYIVFNNTKLTSRQHWFAMKVSP